MDIRSWWWAWVAIGVFGLGLQVIGRNRANRVVAAYSTPRWRRAAEWQAKADRVRRVTFGVLLIVFGLTLRFAPRWSWLPWALSGVVSAVYLLMYIVMVYRRPRA